MKQELNDGLIKSAFEARNFSDRKDIKPIKWIGTQRSAFTHRVKQKRIRDLIVKEKENKQKRTE